MVKAKSNLNIKNYKTIKIIDNILFAILGITVVAEWVINLKETIKIKKRK